MNIIILLVVVGVLMAVYFFLLGKLNEKDSTKKEARQKAQYLYRSLPSVLDKRETAFFHELKKQLPEGYHVFPKMRLADIIETTAKGREYYGQVNRILKKHVDFLICDQYFKPVLAIELNGSSHKTARAQKSDKFKKEVFEIVGVKLEIVQVGRDFASAVQEMVNYL